MKTFLKFAFIITCFISTPCLSASDIINIRQVDSETLDAIMQGKLPDIALEFSKDDQIPLKLFLSGDLIELVEHTALEMFIKINQDLYIKNMKGNIFISANNREWRPIFEFIMGSATVGLGTLEPGSPFINIGAQIFENKLDGMY